MRKNSVLIGGILIVISALLIAAPAYSDVYGEYLYPEKEEKVTNFVNQQRASFNRDPKQLRRMFSYVRINRSLFPKVQKPVERKLEWEPYRNKLVTDTRVNVAAQYCAQHRDIFESVQRLYGVEPSLICAILAIETYVGKNTGTYPVFITLSNLSFYGRTRTKFFKSELGHFLTLSEHELLDTMAIKGSYAGAMGLPQFISSSYLRIAIDYNCDGIRNLWESVDDVVGSVGTYFKLSGWKQGKPTLVPLPDDKNTRALAASLGLKKDRDIKKIKLATLRTKNLSVANQRLLEGRGTAGVFFVNSSSGKKRYFIGLPNFMSILKYNGATFYGMVVSLLQERIQKRLRKISL